MIPVALLFFFFFFKIILAIQGLLCFHTNFKMICSSSVKNAIDFFFAIGSNMDGFGGHYAK